MAEEQQSPSDSNRLSLDKIIESMTADFDNSAGQYVQFGVNPPQVNPHGWGDYTTGHAPRYISGQSALSSQPSMQSVNPMYIPDMSTFDPPPPDPIYFPQQPVKHLGINENNDLVGTIDVGGGNYINVIYGNASQIMAEQCQLSNLASYNSPSPLDREYGLFGEQRQGPIAQSAPPQPSNGKQLIDNLVGNWVPNQSGTYSPFGSSPNVTPVPQSTPEIRESEELPRNVQDGFHKKPRMVAEVRPMRPSYSDVLTKSAPTPPPPLTPPATKPKIETSAKKISNKTTKSKSKPIVLKRQNSSGSEDHSSPKIKLPKKVLEKNQSNLPRRWVSLDNLGSQTESHELNDFDRSENFEKKRTSKTAKKAEKNETLNNSKIQNTNSKCAPSIQKRPIQINNNLNTINSSSQTVSPDKIEKNEQANNKSGKEEKKVTKDKTAKRSQVEKTQQLKKGHRNRKRENRESPVKDLCRNLSRHVSRWCKIGIKIFYWLLHLISDVIFMSGNLIAQLGKCAWIYVLLYFKYTCGYVVGTFSKIKFLNAIGKRLDNWIGWSRFAFWNKFKSKKKEEPEENTNWIRGSLEENIALPSTGEEAMKRLLACKGKDPYSILGVTPMCTDDDIKKYYKRQAFLVHPDKNNQPGAEEAFKILVHAFDIIGEPERRQAFDQTRQVEAAWGELSDLLSQLHKKMEQAAHTIRCTNCGLRHKRIPTHRPCYAARFCAQCKIRHSAKEGDIWAESRVMGFLWNYYACMDGDVYDVTDWAACQGVNLKHLRANTHMVQYRIVLGPRPPSQTTSTSKKRQPTEPGNCEEDFEDFLNNIYNQSKSGTPSTSADPNVSKGDNRRRKTKRKK